MSPAAPCASEVAPGDVRRCDIDGCGRPAESCSVAAAGGLALCAGHRKRLVRGKLRRTALKEQNLPPREQLVVAALAVADADSEDDRAWDNSLDRLERAAEAFVRGGSRGTR